MNFPQGPEQSTAELFQLFTTNPFPFLKQCQQQYGDVFSLNLGNFGIDKYGAVGKWVFINNPNHLEQLFKADIDTIKAGSANDIQFQQLLPGGSVVIDGEDHLERRRILGSSLQGQKKIRLLTDAMHQLINEQIDNLPKNKALSLSKYLRIISNKIIGHVTFGEYVDESTERISAELSNFGNIECTRDLKELMITNCCDLLKNKIDQHKGCPVTGAHTQATSVFSSLLHSEDFKGYLSEEDIQHELIVILLGGADTTAVTMSWAFCWILSDETVYNSIKQELSTVLQGGKPTAEKIDQLTYLDSVIKEACRISPVLFNSSVRLLEKDMTFDSYHLPAGTMVASCAHLTHMNKDNYQNPECFMPERFKDTKPDPYKWVPFGGGIRRCLGMSIALYEIKVVIATILQQVDIEPLGNAKEPELQGSFFGPAGGVMVKIHALVDEPA